jgi:hypothetical protein
MTGWLDGDATMRWFGESWGAPICEECPHEETPVGEDCIHCHVTVLPGDQGVFYANGPVAHLECLFRAVLGPRWREVADQGQRA